MRPEWVMARGSDGREKAMSTRNVKDGQEGKVLRGGAPVLPKYKGALPSFPLAGL